MKTKTLKEKDIAEMKKISELRDTILRDFISLNESRISVHPDCFSHRYNLDNEAYIEILDDFFAFGLIIPDRNNTDRIEWLVEITDKANEFISSGGFSSLPPLKKIKIKDFDSFDLCDYNDDYLRVYVLAEIKGRCLKISGIDLGAVVEEHFCDIDYEYWYYFDEINTKRLFTILSGQSRDNDFKKMLFDNFNGLKGCNSLEKFCYDRKINYNYHSY